MYNRYIPGADGYTRVVVEDAPAGGGRSESSPGRGPQPRRHEGGRDTRDRGKNRTTPLHFFAGEDKNAGMAGILKSLHLEDLDSGDILLLLIILLLFLEGDNIELVITLGLMLLLGLGEEKKDDQKE